MASLPHTEPASPSAAEPALVSLSPSGFSSSSVRQAGAPRLTGTSFTKPSPRSLVTAGLAAPPFSVSGRTASPSSRCAAEERMISWVSLSLGVFDFGMMPSVGDGSVPLHHQDPASRLAAAGCGGLSAQGLKPRLYQPGHHSHRSVGRRTPVLSADQAEDSSALPSQPQRLDGKACCGASISAESAHASPSSRSPDASTATTTGRTTARRLRANRGGARRAPRAPPPSPLRSV